MSKIGLDMVLRIVQSHAKMNVKCGSHIKDLSKLLRRQKNLLHGELHAIIHYWLSVQ